MKPADKKLDRWVSAFPAGEVEQELRELQRQAARIEREIRRRRQLLDARNLFLGITEESSGQVRLAAAARGVVDGRNALTAAERRALRRMPRAVVEETQALPAPAREAAMNAAKEIERDLREARARADRVQIAENASSVEPRREAPEERARSIDASGSRADKLLGFLRSHRGETWKLSDIRDRLVEEGILGDDPVETHGLQVTASRLYRTGRIERPAAGHYRLPADDKEGSV